MPFGSDRMPFFCTDSQRLGISTLVLLHVRTDAEAATVDAHFILQRVAAPEPFFCKPPSPVKRVRHLRNKIRRVCSLLLRCCSLGPVRLADPGVKVNDWPASHPRHGPLRAHDAR